MDLLKKLANFTNEAKELGLNLSIQTNDDKLKDLNFDVNSIWDNTINADISDSCIPWKVNSTKLVFDQINQIKFLPVFCDPGKSMENFVEIARHIFYNSEISKPH